MQEFIGAVQEQISLEHRQWLDDSKSKGEAIGRLEELLQDYEKQRKPVAAAATPPSAPAPVGATKP
jgi:ferric-dicitrate binding protein FerR (iron transport regulator)